MLFDLAVISIVVHY